MQISRSRKAVIDTVSAERKPGDADVLNLLCYTGLTAVGWPFKTCMGGTVCIYVCSVHVEVRC